MPTDVERLAAIESKTDRIIMMLDGNGQPGLITRVAKIEERINMTSRAGLYGGIGGGAAGTGVLGLVLLILDKLGVSL